MKTFYKKISLASMLALVFFAGSSFAQLSGSYTIDGSAAASTTNFTSLKNAITALRTNGVSGPVTFDVKSGQTFTGQHTIQAIAGASATNRITFSGNGSTITHTGGFSTGGVTVYMDGCDYITIDNFKVVNTSSSYGRCFHLRNGADRNVISNNEMNMPNMTSTSNYNGYLWISSGTTSPYSYGYAGRNNRILNNVTDGRTNGGPYWGFFYSDSRSQSRPNDGNTFTNNEVKDFYYYGIRTYYGGQKDSFVDNEIHNTGHTRSGSKYGIYCYNYYGNNGLVDGNYIHHLSGYSSGYAAIYGIYNYGYRAYGKGLIRNNIVHLDEHYYAYGVYAYNYYSTGGTDMLNNTIRIEYDKVRSGRYAYGLYSYYNNGIVRNNTVTGGGPTTWTRFTAFYTYSGNGYGSATAWDYNNAYIDDVNGTKYHGYDQGTFRASLSDWITGAGGANSISVDPKFKGDGDNSVPSNFAFANKGQAQALVTEDFADVTRNSTPDIGALEFFVDASAEKFVINGTKECGNYSETISVDLKNNTNDSITGFEVYYKVNSNREVVETVTQDIAPMATITHTFDRPAFFNKPDTNYITAGVYIADDNLGNNTITNMLEITPSPSGGALTQGSNFPGYFVAGNMAAPDVAAPDYTNEYEIVPPSKYANADYGTDWTLDNISATASGTKDNAGFTFTAPSSTGNGILAYNPSRTMQDSLLYVSMRINDLNTGCDSIIGRYVYVPNIPEASFKHVDVCDGNAVEFENTSKIAFGENMLYKWNFGDTKASDDTSALIDPFYQYVTYGRYEAIMTAVNANFTKFMYYDTASVLITPSPAVDFKAFSACEGEDITFNNLSSDPANSGSTITYMWEFGDNTTDTKTNPTKQYNNPGTYQIKLIATMNGCESEIVKNANQFAKPVVAEFTTSGTCNLEDITFANNTSISIGKAGYVWDLGDGNISTSANPIHSYSTPGAKTVKLLATSEFGCVDSFEKVITLAESPVADFDYNAPCNLDPVTFKNTSTVPAGDNTVYQWDFNGEGLSTDLNPSFKFDELGLKTVTLTATAQNSGCQAVVVKEFNVLLQPEASFTVEDVCDEEEAVFINTSKVAAGNLDYAWSFGDGGTSTDAAPRHAYDISGSASDFEVILVASSKGACADTFSYNIFVNPKPDAGFTTAISGRTATFTPNDMSAGLSYFWRFGDGGQSTDASPSYEYVNVEGPATYEATLYLVNNSGCADEVANTVDFGNFIGIDDIQFDNTLFSVYPNPSNGIFNLDIDAESVESIEVMDMTGKIVQVELSNVANNYSLNLANKPAGVYTVKVVSNNTIGIQKITLSK